MQVEDILLLSQMNVSVQIAYRLALSPYIFYMTIYVVDHEKCWCSFWKWLLEDLILILYKMHIVMHAI